MAHVDDFDSPFFLQNLSLSLPSFAAPLLPPSTTLPSKRHATGTLVTADAAGCCLSAAAAAHGDDCEDASAAIPLPLDFEAMFSTEGRARRMAGLRELVTASAAADKALSPRSKNSSSSSSASAQASAGAAEAASVLGLHGGFPPASSFPFVKLTATLRDGSVIEVDDPAEVKREGFVLFFAGRRRSFGSVRFSSDATLDFVVISGKRKRRGGVPLLAERASALSQALPAFSLAPSLFFSLYFSSLFPSLSPYSLLSLSL